MKTKILLILCMFSLHSYGQSTVYNVNSTKILATENNYNYTEGHFEKSRRFLEFILNHQINKKERVQVLKESLTEFNKNPQLSIQQVNQVDAQMQQIYNLKFPEKIALVRSALLSQLVWTSRDMRPVPFMIKLVEKYTPLLAIDPTNMLAFTQNDFEGYISLYAFYTQLSGQIFNISAQQKQAFRQQLVQKFNQMPLAQKQELCVMEIMNQYTQQSYAQLNAQQKWALQNQIINSQASYYQQYTQNATQNTTQNANDGDYTWGYEKEYDPTKVQWPNGIKTKAQKQAYLSQMRRKMKANQANFGIMNNMMLNNHATMLNVIENTGNTGNYWEVKSGY